jgi:hypothetical protein
MKSQAALEYLTIVGVGMAILIPLVVYLNDIYISYKESNDISSVETTVDKIADTVDWVFSQGPPAKVRIEIFVPNSVNAISFDNSSVSFFVKTRLGSTEIYDYTTVPMVGDLGERRGYYFVSLIAYDNYVNISVV